MDIDTLRVISVVVGSIAFLGVCWWAFTPKHKKRFEEDAKLPFADEEENSGTAQGGTETSEKGAQQNKGQDEQ